MNCPLIRVFCEVLEDNLVLPALAASFSGLHTKLYPVSEAKTATGSNISPRLCLMCHMFALQWASPGIWTDLVLCTDWQKQQKARNFDGHEVREKPCVVNAISADVAFFQLADSCIQVTFEGSWRKNFAVIRKGKAFSLCSTNTREAEQSAMEIPLWVVAFKSFSLFKVRLSASSSMLCYVYKVLINKASCGFDHPWDYGDKTPG